MSYKIMMLGESGVGKTSIARRLKFNSFDSNHKSTIGVELYSLDALCDDHTTRLVLWDTDGNFGEKIFERVFLKGADAAIIVSDLAAPNTIDSMVRLTNKFHDHFPTAPVHSILNKSDIVTPSDAQLSAIQTQCSNLWVCSALTGDGVMQAISALANSLTSETALIK